MRARWVLLLSIAASACGRSRGPDGVADNRGPAASETATTDRGTATVTDAAGPGTATAPDAAAPAPDASPIEAAAATGSTGARGDFCRNDADCGWDDPCMPARCGKASTAPFPGCDESAPPPGTCTCVEQQCTLRPTRPTHGASAPGCTTDADCAIDVATATCHVKGQTLIGPITEQGPVCTCAAGGRCQWSWVGPVPCKTWRDCSWTRAPRLRPVPSSQVPRPVDHPVEACRDGERDSVCTPQGTCRIVAWSC